MMITEDEKLASEEADGDDDEASDEGEDQDHQQQETAEDVDPEEAPNRSGKMVSFTLALAVKTNEFSVFCRYRDLCISVAKAIKREEV